MTAEIAILNRMGVALAADSAVSIGSSGKVYNSANKLFALSKKHPVAIMIHGNAHFMSVPWEVIIKYYRHHEIASRNFSSLKEYADSFFWFLTKTQIIPVVCEADYIETYLEKVCFDVVKFVENEMRKFFLESNAHFDKNFISEKMKDIISKWIKDELSKGIEDEFLTKKEKTSLIKNHGVDVNMKLKNHLQEELKIELSKSICKNIVKIVFMRLFSMKSSISPSGVVVAGFGNDEVFPGICEFSIDGRFCSISKLKANAPVYKKVTIENTAFIAPFAQREMVDTFMRGIDPQYKKAIIKNLEEFVRTSSDVLMDIGIDLLPEQKIALDEKLKERCNALSKAFLNVEQEKFVQPVLNSVSALPLDELAAMAEALVNLTSFKRRVTIVPESVGGPIDVAVISKGDGFIWINRKHYFKPELNHNFFQR